MSKNRLLREVTPDAWALSFEGDRRTVADAGLQWFLSGLSARVVRGRKMHTLDRVFDEFAAAFQFPYYFGENPAAFSECIGDLDNFPLGDGVVVVITEPDQVLQDETDFELSWLVGSLEMAAGVWGEPIVQGAWWDRPPVPFHVVLAGEADALARAVPRWTGVGAKVTPFVEK